MSEYPPTLLIVYLCPEHEEGARFHLDETLTTAGIASRLLASSQERVLLENAAPFLLTHHEKRLVFALRAPLDQQAIGKIAELVMIGLILGFVVKGEIMLGLEEGVFNNLAGY